MKSPNRLTLFLTLCSFALLAYSSVRAYQLSFVHDECLSYRILLGEVVWKDTANHHPLNTRLMGWASRWLGAREWQLRSPNVVGHALYLFLGLLLVNDFGEIEAVLLGFVLLNLNPFLLDFFSLARGYGLALALSMASLLLLVRAYRARTIFWCAVLLVFSSASAALADLANYTWLNFHVAVLAGSLIVLVGWDRTPASTGVRKQRWFYALMIVAANTLFIRSIVRRLWELKEHGQLYGRGETSFVSDTVSSLVATFFYDRLDAAVFFRWVVVGSIIVWFIAAAIILGAAAMKKRNVSLPAIVITILFLAVAAPIVEHMVLGTEYPNRRIALYYVPIAALASGFAIAELLASAGLKMRFLVRSVVIVVCLYALVNFALTANHHRTLDWAYDANTKTAMFELEHDLDLFGGRHINLASNWIFEPSIRYYRGLLHYDWMNVAPPSAPPSAETDVYYGSEEDVRSFSINYTILQRYADTNTVLARFIHP